MKKMLSVLMITASLMLFCAFPKPAAAWNAYKSSVQFNYYSGQSSEIKRLTWNSGEVFANYLSLDNLRESSLSQNLSEFSFVNAGQAGSIISNIFDSGDYQVGKITITDYNSMYTMSNNKYYFRTADTSSGLGTWQAVSGINIICPSRYFQWKMEAPYSSSGKVSLGSSNNYRIDIASNYLQIHGIMSEQSGSGIGKASVSFGGDTETTSDGAYGNTVGSFNVSMPLITRGQTSALLSATASGYQNYQENVILDSCPVMVQKWNLMDRNIAMKPIALINNTTTNTVTPTGSPSSTSGTGSTASSSTSSRSAATNKTLPPATVVATPLDSAGKAAVIESAVSTLAPTNPVVATFFTVPDKTTNQEITYQATDVVAFDYSQTFTLTGKTVKPNQKVKLTIHSNPVNLETTSDADGNWKIDIALSKYSLENGDHTVTAQAVDTDESLSPTVTLAAFKVMGNTSSAQTNSSSTNKWFSYSITYIILSCILVILLAGLIYYRLRFKKDRSDKEKPSN